MRPLATTSLLGILAMAPTMGAGQAEISGVVRSGGQGLEGAVVYLLPESGDGSARPQERTVDQLHLQFVPGVMVVSPGTAVSFLNSDGVLHNVFGPGIGGTPGFDLGTYDQGELREHVFEEEGLHVVLCHIHPEMAAYVIVAPTRYTATTDASGGFEIEGIPKGRYRLVSWHPRHWRSESSMEISVPEEGLSALSISLGRTRARRPAP